MINVGEFDKLKHLTDDVVTELKQREITTWFGNNGNRNWLGRELEPMEISARNPFFARRLILFLTLHIYRLITNIGQGHCKKLHPATGLLKVGYDMYVFNAQLLENAFRAFRTNNSAIWGHYNRQLPALLQLPSFTRPRPNFRPNENLNHPNTSLYRTLFPKTFRSPQNRPLPQHNMANMARKCTYDYKFSRLGCSRLLVNSNHPRNCVVPSRFQSRRTQNLDKNQMYRPVPTILNIGQHFAFIPQCPGNNPKISYKINQHQERVFFIKNDQTGSWYQVSPPQWTGYTSIANPTSLSYDTYPPFKINMGQPHVIPFQEIDCQVNTINDNAAPDTDQVAIIAGPRDKPRFSQSLFGKGLSLFMKPIRKCCEIVDGVIPEYITLKEQMYMVILICVIQSIIVILISYNNSVDTRKYWF